MPLRRDSIEKIFWESRRFAPEKQLATGSKISTLRTRNWKTQTRSYFEQCLENGYIPVVRLSYRKKMRSVLFKLIFAFLILSNFVRNVDSTVAAGSGTSTEMGLELSLLDYDHILLSEDPDRETPSGSRREDTQAISDNSVMESRHENQSTVNMDGFNLLWLVASKLETDDKLIGMDHSSSNSSSSINQHRESVNKDDTDVGNEIYLNSAWPRTYLRYGKKHVPISRIRVASPEMSPHVPPPISQTLSEYLDSPVDSSISPEWLDGRADDRINDENVVRINRFITGRSIGFEMEFRVEEHSGSGYIITGRSVVGQPYFTTVDSTQSVNESSSDQQSWFGLYCLAHDSSYALRLEYKNVGTRSKRSQQFSFKDDFRKGQWQKLAVSIDFDENTINYWVNCSVRPLRQLREDISHPSSFYSVYRLLQHRRRSTPPVEATFRSAVVTDGHRRTVPKQCEREETTVCTGGKVFMQCGPSCERTCRGIQNPQMTDDYLRTCAIACVSGCHCRPGYVSHDDLCVKPDECPCLIGSVHYEARQNLTINNEICTCTKGQWKCYSPPRITIKPKNLTKNIGYSVQLSCGVAGNPQPTISWEVPEGSTHQIVTNDFGRLSIVMLNLTIKEAGIYKCKAQLPSTGWEQVATSVVIVRSYPMISLPPAVQITSGHHVLSIDCSVTGIPTPSITWRKNGRSVQESDRIDINRSPGLARLKIHNVRRADAGEWFCRANNSAGYALKPVRVLVRLPEPNNMAFSRKPVDQYVKRGHTAVFMCKIINYPTSYNVTWLKNGVRMNFTTKRVVTKAYRLVIRQVRDDDAGIYMCVVKVRAGGRELRAKAELMIKGRMLSWSEWSKCSKTCDGGIMFKRRTCTGIPPNEKTCHGRFTHIKRCSTQVCPGTCALYGDLHYTTFDQRKFKFHGICGYILTHDSSGNEFKVQSYNEDCGMGISCLRSVTVTLSMPGLAAVVDIQRNGLVNVNGVKESLPYMSRGSSLVIDKIGLYIIVNAGPDFELKWSVPHRLYVIVGPKYYGRTQGFCGNYNTEPSDDNILRSGRPASSDYEFGLDWAVREGTGNRSCSAFLEPVSEPCLQDRNLRERARGICSYLKNKEYFSHCHDKVSPDEFIETCEFDICRTSIKRTNICFCTALSAYAEECLRHGVVMDWRTDDICPERCEAGKDYEECGPRCIRYCPGIDSASGIVCSSNDRCVSGCHCPRHLVLHKGRCINVTQCPCVYRGVQYEYNKTLDKNCEKCVCKSGKWKCVFNKDLCEFPSSIIKGPLPQVVPRGRSVSFCCEAAGIPEPVIEWYRDGRAVPPQTDDEDLMEITEGDITPKRGYVKSYYKMANLTDSDRGSYYCKATNRLGSQVSESVSLSVVDPWITTCNPTPSKRIISLPEGCSYARANELNVGFCPSLPCFYERSDTPYQSSRNKNKCGGTKQCCRPSSLRPVAVRCTEGGREFSFYITTITKCSCSICESRYTVVEGALLTAMTSELLGDVKIDYLGQVVGYTTKSGSFSLKLLSLPEEARYVSLTFTDIMHKRFPITVKNLPVIVGDTTTHKVIINGHGFKISFDASRGLKHMLRSSMSHNGARLRIVIPPRSVVLQQATNPYGGKADAVISVVEKNYELDRRKLNTIPGDFVGVDLRGNKQILKPSYVVSVSLFSRHGRSLELLPHKFATFLVNTIAVGERMQPWVLDELTGRWRERMDTKVLMQSNVNKRGEKVLQLVAKIPRLNTAFALSESEDACYIRVRALDKDNNTVAGVRFVMTTTEEVPRHNSRSRRTSSSTSQLQTLVESLTRSSDTNGICMPIGCEKFGFITAAKLANDLSPLHPETPLPELGSITTHLSTDYGVTNLVLQTVNTFDSNYLDGFPRPAKDRRTTLYFMSEDQCRSTVADKRTYVFRDNSQNEIDGFREASRKAASSMGRTRVAPLHVERKPVVTRRGKIYCHIKVAVIVPELLSHYRHRAVGNLIAVQAATFSRRNGSDVSTIGSRRTVFRTPVRRTAVSRFDRHRRLERSRPKRALKEICVEYLCGEENPANMAYVMAKHLKESFTKDNPPLQCKFIRASNVSSGKTLVQTSVSNIGGEATNGGSIILSPVRTNRRAGSLYQQIPHRIYPVLAFQARSQQLSKNKCFKSRGLKYTSALIRCL